MVSKPAKGKDGVGATAEIGRWIHFHQQHDVKMRVVSKPEKGKTGQERQWRLEDGGIFTSSVMVKWRSSPRCTKIVIGIKPEARAELHERTS